MNGNAGRVSDNRTVMLTTILKGMGFNITNNSVYDSWATLAAVDAIQRDYYEITNGDFYNNLISLLSLMSYDSDGAIKSTLANSQAYYKNSLITGQKIWEEQRKKAELEAAEETVLDIKASVSAGFVFRPGSRFGILFLTGQSEDSPSDFEYIGWLVGGVGSSIQGLEHTFEYSIPYDIANCKETRCSRKGMKKT